ncbi:HD domain-containing phosphohydrolase [Paenibacillus sp. FSL R5-0407]|uniref:HD-GYP domain-containing protein n=1 Tax=Paenibacillus sp. FSL R5-0407 TaxID=2975320 RepID=UPI0030F6035E
MKTHVMEIQEGDRLRTDIFNQAGLHVLPKGTSIHKEEIALLIRQNINYVDIEPREDELSLSGLNRQDFTNRLKENFERTVLGYQSIFLEALTTGKFNQSMVEEKLQPMLEIIDSKKDVVSLLITFGENDTNLYTHSLQVGLLSYYIASWLGYTPAECYEISKAGYLHDIGKSKLRQELRNHAGPFNEAQIDELKRHTRYGYEIIRDSMTDEVPALVALQHHEREDGSGYPQGLKKDEIHPYAQIVAVANTYVEMTSPDNAKGRLGLLTVLRKVYELGFGELNERAVQALARHLIPQFIGKQARLSNGETATIVWNNPSDFFRPLVQVKDRFRDLAVERDIVVEDIFM